MYTHSTIIAASGALVPQVSSAVPARLHISRSYMSYDQIDGHHHAEELGHVALPW